MTRVAHQDAHVVGLTRTARAEVARRPRALAGARGARPRARRPDPRPAQPGRRARSRRCCTEQLTELAARSRARRRRTRRSTDQLQALEKRAAEQAARAAATGNANVGGIAVDTARHGPAAARRAGGGRRGDRRRQRDRHPPLHLRRRPRLVPRRRLRLLGLGQLRAGGRRAGQLADGLGRLRGLGRPGSRPVDHDLRQRRATSGWTVAGWRFDTVALAESGTRWAQGGGEFSGFVVRHPPGL